MGPEQGFKKKKKDIDNQNQHLSNKELYIKIIKSSTK